MTNKDTLDFSEELAWALRLHKAGVFEGATDTYLEILQSEPLHPEASFLLGSIELHQGDTRLACLHLAVAASALNSTAEAQAAFSRAYKALDVAMRKTTILEFAALLAREGAGELSAAIIRLLRLLGEKDHALSLAETALEASPTAGELLKLRGQLLLDIGRAEEAFSAFKAALKILPNDCELLTVYSANLARAGRAEEALVFAEQAATASLCLASADARRAALVQLLSCFIELQRLPDAYQALLALYKSAPHLPETWSILARCLYFSGRQGDAEVIAGKGAKRFPNHIELEWLQCIYALAPIYQSTKEIHERRKNYASRLSALASRLTNADKQTRSHAQMLSQDLTTYLLPYQYGENDRRLQEIYGGLLVDLSEITSLPKSVKRRSDNRITIAFMSAFVWRHTNWRMKRGWLKFLDRDRFHVACLHLGERCDEMTTEIQGYCDTFHHLPSDYHGAVRVLRDMRPEVVFYLEVGMSGTAQRLAADRLAPVQCCAIGHPVTTGLTTIDYFVSGELIEPKGAEAHYSETLIKLPGISFPYLPAPLPKDTLRRSHFGLPEYAPLFLCLQTPQKYLPANDSLYPRIAAEVPKAVFVFLGGGSSIFDMSILKDRLVRAFREAELDPELYLRFLPHLSPGDYQALNALGDVYLDTPGWSGGNTTLEAIYQGLPIVTMRGHKMRACVSTGMLELIGMSQTIAADENEYVNIASRLALDEAWNASVRNRLIDGRSRLETDMRSVRAIENFFETAVNAAVD